MNRFFVSKDKIKNNKIIIDTDDVKHICKVLRFGVGDKIQICDGDKHEYICKITLINKDYIECETEEEFVSQTEPKTEVILIQGLPKQSKMEYIIQKTTEIGISKIYPCKLERCVVKLDGKETTKSQRWQKVAAEASKQCGRGIIPTVNDVALNINDAIDVLKNCDIAFAAYESEKNYSLKDLFRNYINANKQPPKKIGFLIGPEGGLSDDEVAFIKNSNIECVTLGNRILRTETAGAAVTAMCMYQFEL